MIYFELRNRHDNSVLESTLAKCSGLQLFESAPLENAQRGGFKNIVREYPQWIVRLIASDDDELLNSARAASRTADAYAEIAPVLNGIKRDNKAAFKVFFHNLVTTHAQLQGEIEAIFPERLFIEAESHAEQTKVAREAIAENQNIAAGVLLEVMKRVVDLQAQIEGFKILTGEVRPDFGRHNIRKVLLRSLAAFYEQFRDADLHVKIYINEVNAATKQVRLDFKLFSVAMHHFLDNTAKYAKRGSEVHFSFDPETMILEISMDSVRIETDEVEEIFKLGRPGKHAQAFPGEGIGMYMVGRALEIMDSRMDVIPDQQSREIIMGVPYGRNRFLIPLSAV